MNDRDSESVSVHGSERVAARDYVEVHDYHETHSTNITAPGSNFFLTPPPQHSPEVITAGPEIGYCSKCQHAIWIHAAVCRHCGFDPAIEAAQQKARADGALMLFAFGWLGASAIVYQLLELIGLASMTTSAIVGFIITLAVAAYAMWPHDR